MADQLPVLLRVIRDEPEPDAPETAGPALTAVPEVTTPAPMIKLDGDRMARPDQFRAAAAHGWRAAKLHARQLRDDPGSAVGGLMGAQPPSVTAECEYARTRAWVIPGHEGGLLEGMGVVWHAVIGRPGVAVGNLVSGLSSRPYCGTAAAAAVLALATATAYATGHHTAALLIAAGALLAGALWAGAGLLWLHITRPAGLTESADDITDQTEESEDSW